MIARYKRELSVALAYALLLLLLAIKAPGFYKGGQIPALLVSSAPNLVAAVGITMVILSRQIDISIGSQFCVCGVIAGLLAKGGVPMVVVVPAVLVAGAAMGSLNGVLVALLRLPSIVVTLATLVILREGLRWWREGEFVRNLPDSFQWLGMGQMKGQWILVGVALVVFAIFAISLRHLVAGRAIYALGSDAEAARLAGIRPRTVTLSVFVLMGALTGLAALLNDMRFVDIDPNSGTGLELEVIAAVVVGGVAVSGGRGTLLGALIGVALLSTVRPALVFLGSKAQWDKVIQGAIILLAVASDAFYQKGK